jgi:hypothetical protein
LGAGETGEGQIGLNIVSTMKSQLKSTKIRTNDFA